MAGEPEYTLDAHAYYAGLLEVKVPSLALPRIRRYKFLCRNAEDPALALSAVEPR